MKYVCPVCGYVYDEEVGIQNTEFAAGTRWVQLSSDWKCPGCRESKTEFRVIQAEMKSEGVSMEDVSFGEKRYEMSPGELSALCSGLAGSCTRQYLVREAELFMILAEYYKAQVLPEVDVSVESLSDLLAEDMTVRYVKADAAAETVNGRGAKRILRWSGNTTRISDSILNRYISQGNEFLQNAGVYICEVCGYIRVGDALPAVCPVCRAPEFRIVKVE